MATAATLLAERLYEAGCRHAFGIPGGEVLTVMHGLIDAGIRFELCKHENAGGFMAEGTYHMTGAPGILVATLGPGVANAVNVIANAQQDRVPLIFLTGCVDPAEAATYTHQVFDHTALLGSITKASLTLADGAVDVIADKALALALDGQPGPVHIDVPISLAAAEQSGNARTRRPRPAPSAPAPGPNLDRARAAFAAAERPLMIAGVDVLNHGAEAAVADFCRDYAVPLITTYKAKGILAEDDPLAIGGAGLSPLADGHLLGLVEQSDCILLAGYDPIEMRTGWRNPWSDETPTIEFSATHNSHYMHQAGITFVCDVGAGLAALRGDIDRRDQPSWADRAPARVRGTIADAFAADEDWGPAAIVDVTRQAMPRDTVATVDSGAHRILLSQVWECYGARGLLQSTGLCTMGCALPLATGAKLAAPDRPVVAFTGDAGLEMVLGELATLRDLSLNVVIIVFVDRSLALIEKKQREAGFANAAVGFGGTDWAAVAKAMGGAGALVDNRADLSQEIDLALERESFTLIGCEIGDNAYDGRI